MNIFSGPDGLQSFSRGDVRSVSGHTRPDDHSSEVFSAPARKSKRLPIGIALVVMVLLSFFFWAVILGGLRLLFR